MNDTFINFTWFESTKPIGKQYQKDLTGKIQNEGIRNFIKGKATYLSIPFKELPEKLDQATSCNALTSGVFNQTIYGKTVICMIRDSKPKEARDLQQGNSSLTVISRTNDNIKHEYNEGNGLVILDIDAPSSGTIIKPNDLYQKLCELVPGFSETLCFSIGSSSSRIVGLNKQGYRMYLPSSTPNLIPQFIRRLFDHLQLNGKGWCDISIAGQILRRTYIDKAMQSAVQLDFCGPANVDKGITVNSLAAYWHNSQGGALDCRILEPLTKKEKAIVNKQLQTKEIKAEVAFKRAAYQSKKEAEYLEYQANGDGKTENLVLDNDRKHLFRIGYHPIKEERIARDNYIRLPATHILYFENKGAVSVADVMDNPQNYVKQSLADPVEGVDYPSGKKCAILYCNPDQTPIIHSFAHGGMLYRLSPPPRPAFESIDALPVEEAAEKLQGVISDFFKRSLARAISKGFRRDNPHLTVAATPGLGKTQAVFYAVNEMKQRGEEVCTHLYIPTHKLANELQSKMNYLFPELVIQVRRGRSVEGYCDKYDQVKPYEGVVPSIRKAFCDDGAGEQCTYIRNCRYIAQFKEDFDILILAHQYLKQPLPRTEKQPNIVVIDESFYHVVTDNKKFTADDLKGILSHTGRQALQATIELYSKPNNLFNMQLVIQCGVLSDDIYSELKQDIDRFVKQYEEISKDVLDALNPASGQASRRDRSQQVQDDRYRYRFAKVLQAIYSGQENLYSFCCVKQYFYLKTNESVGGLSLNKTANQVQIFDNRSTARYCQFIEGTPILCIDGGADERLSAALLCQQDNHVSFNKPGFIRIEAQRNLCVTQCNSRTFSQYSLLESNDANTLRENVAKVINRAVKSNYAVYKEKTLLVTYKKLKDLESFRTLLNIEHLNMTHFNALRGQDIYNSNHIIILGRNEPATDMVKVQTENIFELYDEVTMAAEGRRLLKEKGSERDRRYAQENPPWVTLAQFLKWIKFYHREKGRTEINDYLKDDGVNGLSFALYRGGEGVPAEKLKGQSRFFLKESNNTMLMQIRENELLQALARSRDVRANSHRQVLLLGSLALDIQVDRVFTWAELNAKQQQQDVLQFYNAHNGFFVKAPTLLNQLQPHISVYQWKERVKLPMEQYIEPMGTYDIQQCKLLSDANKSGKPINFNQHLSVTHIKEVKVKLRGKSNNYTVIYDANRHTKEGAVQWILSLMDVK